MSRLIDKLNQLSKDVPQGMGFRTTQTASPKPQMLLIANLTQAENVDRLTGSVTGADAVLLHIAKSGSEAKSLQKLAQSLPDIPWGGCLEDIDEERIGTLAKAGCDFVVFPAASKVSVIPQNDELGKILEVESSLSEGLLRTVNKLPVDAILITAEEEWDSLTWHHLMLFHRFANLLTKPLLASIPLNVTASELNAIWKVGVDGVVVEVSTEQPTEKLKELRQAIDSSAFSPRKRRKIEALLPYISGETSAVAEEEAEEE